MQLKKVGQRVFGHFDLSSIGFTSLRDRSALKGLFKVFIWHLSGFDALRYLERYALTGVCWIPQCLLGIPARQGGRLH